MRIDFTNSKMAAFVAPGATDKGIKTHTRIGTLVRNIFAKLGLCSSVIKYSCTLNGKKQFVYINQTSFNNWLIRRTLPSSMKDKIEAATSAKKAPRVDLIAQAATDALNQIASAKKAENDDF